MLLGDSFAKPLVAPFENRHVVAAFWRPGTATASLGFRAILRRLLSRLRSTLSRVPVALARPR